MHPSRFFIFYFLFFTLLISANKTYAQDVNGKWYGIGTVDINTASSNYLCEFIITQEGSNVTGFFNYFFRDGYFSSRITGTFNKRTRLFTIKPVPVLYFRTINAGTGPDCIMTGNFFLKVAQTESTLTGSFDSDPAHVYTAPPIKIKLRKLLQEEPTLLERVEEEKEPAPVETPEQKTSREAEKSVQMRTKDLTKILDVSEDSVKIDLYDNGEFDYDTISVFYNNKLVQYKQLLNTREPITFKVHVDSVETNNDLTMFAENLGTIPPNSAIMIITDKTHRYEVPLTSTYQKNGTVRLRKIKPPGHNQVN